MPKLSFKKQLLLVLSLGSIIPVIIFIAICFVVFKPDLRQSMTLAGSAVIVGGLFAVVSVVFFNKLLQKHFGKLFFLLDKTSAFLPQQVVSPEADDVEKIIRVFESFKITLQNYSQKNQNLDFFSKLEQEKLSSILSNIQDPVLGLDLRFNITFFNKAAAEVLGISPEESINQPIEKLFKFYDKNRELSIQQIVTLKSPGFAGVLFKQEDIKIVSLLVNKEAYATITSLQLHNGPAFNLASILIFHDATKEKQLEAMKLDFVSMAAHELRTPLTSIKGYISVFIQENEKKLNEDQMMFIRRINTSTQQLSALIENLLGVARVERGAMNITTQPMDWVQNVQTQKEMFEHRAVEKRIELVFQKPQSLIPTVQADSVRINEVLNNFISNAINYTEPGGKITITVEFKNNEVITHVIDSGRGIPKEALDHLFTKFYRVPGNLDQASKGNGLGLYISKAIIDLHKGRIWAESEGLGKGSVFSFSLPVIESNTIDISVLTKKL